ncbi:branched-chain amino acid transaminase [Gelidibacter salicanalis]|uniref:Branched-chain-amino-acid aminotransferase n=1 Tax=Gelidibacter salicanalis TaxID=291193 RepID=A0A934KRY2_9FLAO|nr:branched-chain amino acid transaminase [Gelidibacter salicanalis]MBJ7879573.1 branched-chain amino acid transaminase [Gelidibacter salicanalis]
MNAYYNNQTIIYHKGEFLKPEAATSSLYSQSLHYGNGVFEGIRSYKTEAGTKIFKAKAHYERLKYGAKVMGIPFNYSIKELTAITHELLERNQLEDAYIRPIISTGANMGLYTSKESILTMQCWAWGKLMGDKLLRVKTSSFERPNPKSCFVEAKVTGHYINSILSTNEAKDAGFDEALLLDMYGNVAECSGANIFMEKDGKLFTPKKGSIMAGITRSTILEICKEEGIPVEERHFKLDELKQADSSFFTGTAAEVVGLKSLDDYEFPLQWTDSLGHKLMKLYQQEVLGQRKNKLSKAL